MACGVNLGRGLFLYSLHGQHGFTFLKDFFLRQNVLRILCVTPKPKICTLCLTIEKFPNPKLDTSEEISIR